MMITVPVQARRLILVSDWRTLTQVEHTSDIFVFVAICSCPLCLGSGNISVKLFVWASALIGLSA